MAQIPVWLIWIGAIGAAVTTAAIFARVALALARMASKVDQLTRVIDPVIEMAQDFKANGGSTLKDTVNRIDQRSLEAVGEARQAAIIASDAKAQVNRAVEASERAVRLSEDNNRILYELRGLNTAARSDMVSPP
jgi:biopolymer transport protein ExbB/TolQ